jgi:hypothetical protein
MTPYSLQLLVLFEVHNSDTNMRKIGPRIGRQSRRHDPDRLTYKEVIRLTKAETSCFGQPMLSYEAVSPMGAKTFM